MLNSLSDIITPDKWVFHDEPFLHLTSSNVFSDQFYAKLHEAYVEFLTKLIIKYSQNEYNQTIITGIDYNSPKPLQVFLSAEWHSRITDLFGIKCTNDVNVAIHYHKKNTPNGWVHNDLNPGWFVDKGTNEINQADNKSCNYQTGKVNIEGIIPKRTIRSIAMIFYINNPTPSEMVGGGTGLYKSNHQPVGHPSVIIPAVNNSLLIFPITPYSFHAFLANKSHQRCSIIMWLHSPVDYVVHKWGEDQIVNWV
jgi:hypothetical protein